LPASLAMHRSCSGKKTSTNTPFKRMKAARPRGQTREALQLRRRTRRGGKPGSQSGRFRRTEWRPGKANNACFNCRPLAVLARLGRCLFDRLAETKSERLLNLVDRIRFCRAPSSFACPGSLSKTGEYLDLAETTAQARTAKRAPAVLNRHRSRKGTQAAHLGRKARNPARGQCPAGPTFAPCVLSRI